LRCRLSGRSPTHLQNRAHDDAAGRIVAQEWSLFRELRSLFERFGRDDGKPANPLLHLRHRHISLNPVPIEAHNDPITAQRRSRVAKVAGGLELLEPLTPGLHGRVDLSLWSLAP
jgi:hypothetical protein